jgi:hypothetical protein
MVEITLPIVLQIIQTVSLVVGIIYYLTIMRNTQRTRELSLKAQEDAERNRQRDMIIQRSQSYSLDYIETFQKVMLMMDWETPEEWEEKYYRTNNVEAFSKWSYITRLYHLAGLLMRQGVDPEIIFALYPEGAIISLWEQYESVIQYLRKRYSPDYLDSLEYLFEEAKKRRPELLNRSRIL